MAIAPQSEKRLYENLIVDEVQDLRPAEWRILDMLLRPEGRWSLFGDMNQRRADVSWASWDSLLTHLEIVPADGSTPDPEVLSIGYRSNDVILRYAGWLLPRHQRSHGTLRGGAEDSVQVRRVRSADLFGRAEEAARRFRRGVQRRCRRRDRLEPGSLRPDAGSRPGVWMATRSGAGKPNDVHAP